jgi:AraC-like DNA-binding protein
MNFPASSEPTGLRRFRMFESDDVDETCERFSQILVPHTLAPVGGSGRFRARMNSAKFGKVSLTTIEFGVGMKVDAGAGSEHYCVLLCLRGHADARINGQTIALNSSRGVLNQPGSHLKAEFSPACEQLLVRMPCETVSEHLGFKPKFERTVNLDRPELLPWLQQVLLIATSTSLLDCLQRYRPAADSMERLLIALLIAGQPWSDTIEDEPHAIAPRSVRRAEAFIEAHAGESIRLEQIAAAADVPARTLHAGFRRFRSYTPMQYLSNVRLDLARGRLTQAEPGALVVHVALDCGFLHLGRFASAYQRRFGESPSATLRRATGDAVSGCPL